MVVAYMALADYVKMLVSYSIYEDRLDFRRDVTIDEAKRQLHATTRLHMKLRQGATDMGFDLESKLDVGVNEDILDAVVAIQMAEQWGDVPVHPVHETKCDLCKKLAWID